MFRTLSTLLAIMAIATPAEAQFNPPGMAYPVAASTPTPTPSTCDMSTISYESLGSSATSVTSGGTNAEGSFVTLGTTSVEMNGFWLFVMGSQNATRGLVDIYIGSGVTPLVDDFYTNSTPGQKIFFPINIPAGSVVTARTRSSGNAVPYNILVVAQKRGTGCAAGYSRAEGLNVDTAATRAGLVEVSYGTPWVDLLGGSTTNKTYQGFAIAVGSGTTTPTAAGFISWQFGKGASGSETQIGSGMMTLNTTVSGTQTAGGGVFIGQAPTGTRLVGRLVGNTTMDGTHRFQVMGIY